MDYNKKNSQNTNFNQESHNLTENAFNAIEYNVLNHTHSKARTKKLLDYVDKIPDEKMKSSKLTPNVIKSVHDCGSWLEFRNYFEVDKTKLHNANFCKKDKLCPACANRRASLQRDKVFKYIQQNPELSKKHWYYIVLPVKHNKKEDFDIVFNRAKDGLKSLRKSINNSKSRNTQESFFSNFNGLFYAFEVTKTYENGWNNHINLLCCSDEDIKGIYKYTFKDGKKAYQHKGIMQDWAKYTDNKSYMHSINKVDTSNPENLKKNLYEIFKYTMKFQELENKDLLEAYDKTFNKRLMGAFGSLYGINTKVNLNEAEVLGTKYLEIIYRFDYITKQYFQHSREIKELDCKTRDYGNNNYKFVNVYLGDTNKLLTRSPIKQKRKIISHFDDDLNKKTTHFKTDWEIFKKTMRGINNTE